MKHHHRFNSHSVPGLSGDCGFLCEGGAESPLLAVGTPESRPGIQESLQESSFLFCFGVLPFSVSPFVSSITNSWIFKNILNRWYFNQLQTLCFNADWFCCSPYVSTFLPDFLPVFKNFEPAKKLKESTMNTYSLYLDSPVVYILPCLFSSLSCPLPTSPPDFLLKPLIIICRHNDTSSLNMSA